MTDKELLELAAKASGLDNYDPEIIDTHGIWIEEEAQEYYWNPLTDDGDALRLAVKLGMDICFGANYVIVRGSVQSPLVNNANDPYAATRRAIVRAAAEIAKWNERVKK